MSHAPGSASRFTGAALTLAYPIVPTTRWFDQGQGQGNAGGQQQQDQTPPAGITPEQVNQMVNAAVTAQLNRLVPKALESAMGPALEKLATSVTEAVSAKLPKPPEPPPPGGAAGNPELTELQKQVKALEATNKQLAASWEESRQAAAAAEERRRNDSARAALSAELAKKVRPEALDFVVGHLFDSRKSVTFDEAGNPLLKVKHRPYPGAPEEESPLPFDKAVTELLKDPSLALFLPAPGGGATGTGKQPTARTQTLPHPAAPPAAPPGTPPQQGPWSEDAAVAQAGANLARLEAAGLITPGQ